MQLKQCSPQYAKDNGFFGPVWHGTDQEAHQMIREEGFKIPEESKNGYLNENYRGFDFPSPLHHLGYGIYFTTVKSIAKMFNGNTTRGLVPFALDVSHLETINFGSEKTMMKWWLANGYSPELAKTDRIQATKIMTGVIKSKYDAVWYKGKGLSRLLDGDQVCIYDPELIYAIDEKTASGLEIGAKVIRNSDGMRGVIRERRELSPDTVERFWSDRTEKYVFTVKWKTEPMDRNVGDKEISPVSERKTRKMVTLPVRKVNLRRK